jgi:hypothetical protein
LALFKLKLTSGVLKQLPNYYLKLNRQCLMPTLLEISTIRRYQTWT